MKWHRLRLGRHVWDELHQGRTSLGLMNTRPGKLHSHEIMLKGSPLSKMRLHLNKANHETRRQGVHHKTPYDNTLDNT